MHTTTTTLVFCMVLISCCLDRFSQHAVVLAPTSTSIILSAHIKWVCLLLSVLSWCHTVTLLFSWMWNNNVRSSNVGIFCIPCAVLVCICYNVTQLMNVDALHRYLDHVYMHALTGFWQHIYSARKTSFKENCGGTS